MKNLESRNYEFKSYHTNGQLAEHAHVVNDQLHGECHEYHDNGQLWIHQHYVNGKRHGEFKLYYSNGQLYVHTHFVDGKRHGEYKEYNQNGQLDFHCFYQHHIDITNQIKSIVNDISNITQQEQLIIQLKYNIPCLN